VSEGVEKATRTHDVQSTRRVAKRETGHQEPATVRASLHALR
jgi:hypothetical protein